MLPTASCEPDQASETTDQEQQIKQLIDLLLSQEQNMPLSFEFQNENEFSLQDENECFADSPSPKPQLSEVSTDTLRLLGIFDTKPIVSCAGSEQEIENYKKVTCNNFKVKVNF